MKKLLSFLFLSLFSLSLLGQNCSILAKANNITPDKLCSPVTVNWNATYTGVQNNGTNVSILYEWGDGTPNLTIPATNIGSGAFQADVIHVYTSRGNVCNYHPQVTLIVNGVLCTSSSQQQIVTVWDDDNHNGGHMHINPTVYPICVGNSANVRFQDLTQFNCVPPQENDVPNEFTRWIQWEYGTDITMTGIPVTINGNPQTFPYAAPIITLPGPVTGSGVWSDVINVANDKLVGQYFQVTLRNWNYCNPYDDPNIPGPPADIINGDHPPVITTAIILIVAYPDATITPVGTLCLQSPRITLTARDAGGTWSGDGVTGNRFNPLTAGVGNHIIKYTITNSSGCTASDTTIISVVSMPNATINPVPNMCIKDSTIILTAHDAGGIWSGDGVIGNTFNPTLAGIGTHVITYNITDINSCSNSDQISILVNAIPDATITPIGNVCISNTSINLISHDLGGTWTGDGVVGNTFNSLLAGVGIHNIKYVIKNGGCISMDSINITVFPTPNASINPIKNFCINDVPFILTAPDTTGIWAGDGVVENTFNPTLAGIGTHTISYTVTNSYGCSDSTKIATIVVTASPDATITPIGNICMSNKIITLSAHDIGGIWSGDGVVGNTFDSEKAGVGTHIIKYSINLNSCVDSDQISVTVYPSPNATITPVNNLCLNSPSVTLMSPDISGLWVGDGLVDNNIFNPFIAGVGNHTIEHYIINFDGCQDSDHIVIKVSPVPNATITPIDTMCVFHPAIALHTVDTGGVWSGAISTNIFDPGVAGIGNHIIKYKIINSDGCQDSDQITIVVIPIPTVYIDRVSAVFINTPPFQLNVTPTGGLLSGPGVEDGTSIFNPLMAGIGDHIILYQTAPNRFQCFGTDTIHIKVIMPTIPVADFKPDTVGCAPLTITFKNNSIYATSYLWDFGDNTFTTVKDPTHTYKIAGNYIVKMIASNISGESIHNGYVNVFQNPTANFSIYPPEITNNTQIVVFTNNSIFSVAQLWSFGDGAVSSEESPWHKYKSEGSYNVTLLVRSQEGCIDSTSLITPINVKFTVGKIKFPNAFVWNRSGPTGGYWHDGEINDNIFRPHFENVIEYNLKIFNRWGVLLYESNDLYKGWDGYFGNGNLALQGVYVWKATGRYTDGRYFDIVGDVTFLH